MSRFQANAITGASRRRAVASRQMTAGGLGRLLALGIAVLVLAVPACAAADGDPGSDVLVFQNLFYGPDDNISAAQELQLDGLLDATTALHAPVRVAIIGRRDDLGTVTPLWGDPAAYATYLGTELELAYGGRVVVVMPQGVATFWSHHGSARTSDISSGPSADRLVGAATAAVHQLEAAAGVSDAQLLHATHSSSVAQSAGVTAPRSAVTEPLERSAAGTEPTAGASATNVSPGIVVIALTVGLGAVFWIPPLWRRRRGLMRQVVAVPGLTAGVVVILALVVLAVVVHSSGVSSASASSLATNPSIDPGSPVTPARTAPNFTLTDETGRRISLSQYRGKVVILSFADDECQTICPLATQAMLDARDSLGPAAKDVQLLGVNANWRSTQVDDVLSYTELHGLLGQWHFLTGTRAQLQRVWDQYGVGGDINAASSLIDHTPAIDIIDPEGRLREVYVTQPSYGAIAQFGQVLAREASRLLPGHPAVHTDYSYRQVKPISASTRTTLEKVGGGSITLGAGKPHLYLFFATWDQQSTPIKAEMEQLNAYTRAAKRLGLPPITAVDEGSVEPSPSALSSFLTGTHLEYPVAIDTTGRVADGYGVEGEPWFVLTDPGAINPTPWDQEVYTEGWPGLKVLEADVRGALKPENARVSSRVAKADLAGSPAPLAQLHAQASRLLPGGEPALSARIKSLRGYPIVVNVWASWCVPCQKEFGWFADASALYGKRVAFLGADYDEASRGDAANFLSSHRVSYPSYSITDGSIGGLLPGGLEGTPTTLFIAPDGKVVSTWIGQEPSEQALAEQIRADP